MDPRDRADVAFARARARDAYVVTPANAISPMDAANTLRIPASVIAAADIDTQREDHTVTFPQWANEYTATQPIQPMTNEQLVPPQGRAAPSPRPEVALSQQRGNS